MTPAPLRHSSANVLEFESLRELLSGYIRSPLGKSHLAELQPSSDEGWIQNQHALTAEIRGYRRVGGSFDFSGLADVSQWLEKSRISGAALESEEIRDVILAVDLATQWREIVFDPPAAIQDSWSAVTALSSQIADFSALRTFLRGKIQPDGTLDDRASPELARIRREMEKQRRSIEHALQGYLRRLSEDGSVQDELVTIRGERFVIPIKVEQKRRVPGVVHGASSSGQTVFIEPLEMIEPNNELVRLRDEEQAEIHRVLLEMTRRIGENSPAIALSLGIMAEVELQFAKARFAEDYNCVSVSFSADRAASRLILRNARHPLLERNLRAKEGKVVPLTMELEGERRQLIISGPNTGGKTVGLKTAGLLVIMAQAGIPVPADRAEMTIFDAVLADIGDYQSIEQNLSTFSAHVTNIDSISRTATRNSLVLLDELGSATDPEEGAALAVSIAEYVERIGCVSIISTHHTSLKVYGANHSGVVNASVGFDEASLRPTYELKTGVPGASAGINIAQRLGLNPAIIEDARSRLGSQTKDISRFLDRLHEQLREVESEQLRLRQKEQELTRDRDRLSSEGKKEQQAKVREMEKKLEAVLREFEYHAREAINAIQDRAAAQKLSKEADRRVAKLRREFREQFDSAVVAHSSGADRGDPNAEPSLVKHVSEGDTVKLKSVGRPGRVLRKLDQDHFEVEIGAMKMRVARSDIASVLAQAAESPVKAARAKGVSVVLERENESVPQEINVIGRTVDEATTEVEKFVDRAFLAGLPSIRVVHGSGMGILRKALRQYLQKHPHVEAVKEAEQNQGGGGATVVELRV